MNGTAGLTIPIRQLMLMNDKPVRQTVGTIHVDWPVERVVDYIENIRGPQDPTTPCYKQDKYTVEDTIPEDQSCLIGLAEHLRPIQLTEANIDLRTYPWNREGDDAWEQPKWWAVQPVQDDGFCTTWVLGHLKETTDQYGVKRYTEELAIGTVRDMSSSAFIGLTPTLDAL